MVVSHNLIFHIYTAHRLFAWRSLPIEPNACSAQLARQNLIDNGIGLSVGESDQLPSARELEGDTAYVVVCNPPWFSGDANHEKECDGGEVAFSRRLISGMVFKFFHSRLIGPDK